MASQGRGKSVERRKNPISLSKEESSPEEEREREREIEDRELSSRRNVKEIMRRKRLRHQFRPLVGPRDRIRIQVLPTCLGLSCVGIIKRFRTEGYLKKVTIILSRHTILSFPRSVISTRKMEKQQILQYAKNEGLRLSWVRVSSCFCCAAA